MRPLALLLTGCLALAACGGSDDAGPASTQAPSTETPSTEPPATEPPATEPPATEPPDTEPAATEPPATEPPAPELAAFEPVGLGEYEVGVSTITITDPVRDRPLTVDVWFPLADGATGDPHRYTFITGDYYESPRAITAAPDLVAPDGPFPLVVYSHGSGGIRYIHSDYTETLASHGYVVAAPDHTGNTAVERVADTPIDRDQVALDRPADVIAVIDAMLNPESTETVGFVATVDPERIAVTGHSFGGYTAYAVVSGYANDLGTTPPDGRVDAIIPLAPAVGDGASQDTLLTDGRLEAVQVPQLVMVGTDDATTPPDPNVTRAFELSSSDPLYRVDLVAAEHQSFTDVCDYLDFFPTLDPPPSELVVQTIEEVAVEGCSEGDMEIDRVQEITNTFAVAFLESVFEGTEMITDANTAIPDDVMFAAR